jgi:hypothetical protein
MYQQQDRWFVSETFERKKSGIVSKTVGNLSIWHRCIPYDLSGVSRVPFMGVVNSNKGPELICDLGMHETKSCDKIPFNRVIAIENITWSTNGFTL